MLLGRIMASEIIYEDFGEVDNIDLVNKSIISIKVAEGDLEDSIDQPMFNQGTSDAAVVDYIFNNCDPGKTGQVLASTLVQFCHNHFDSENHKETFQPLLDSLDPKGSNPLVTVKVFQTALKKWFYDTDENNSESFLNLSDMKQPTNQSDSLNSSCFTSADSLSPRSSADDGIDVKELQFQLNKLIEEKRNFLSQITEADETISSLRSENAHLKIELKRIETETAEKSGHSHILEEDINQLHIQIQQLKDDLQKMSKQYNESRSEIEEKKYELEKLRLISVQDEMDLKQLSESLKQLEKEKISKEQELSEREREIQRISRDLMEHQLLSESLMTSMEFDRKITDSGDTLASELQSSQRSTPWRKSAGTTPGNVHVAAYAMFNEPEEYEDLPLKGSSSVEEKDNQCHNSTCEFQDEMTSKNDNDSTVGLDFSPQSLSPSKKTSTNIRDSPRKSDASLVDLKAETVTSDFQAKLRNLFWIVLYIGSICLLLSWMSTFLLPISSFSDCSYIYRPTAVFYPSSFWSKIIEIVKPYCTIEYHGCPPV